MDSPGGYTITNGSSHTLAGTGSISAALVNNGTVSANVSGQTLTLAGALPQYSGGTLTGGTWIAKGGTLSLNSVSAITTIASAVMLDGPGSSFPNVNAVANNTGTFGVLDGYNFTTAGGLQNSGTIQVGSGSAMSITGSYTPTAGSRTIVDGTLNASPTVWHGVLSGAGLVHANLTMAADALLMPGDDPGTLTVQGNLALADQSSYTCEIGASAVSLVHVTGNLSFGADETLNVALFGSGMPAPGDYPLFTVDGTIGPEPTWHINLPPGISASGIVTMGNQVVLENVAVPEPSRLTLLSALALGMFGRFQAKRRGRAR